MITLLSPANGAEISVLTKEQRRFIKEFRDGMPKGPVDFITGESSWPAAALFRWTSEDAPVPHKIEVSESEDFEPCPHVNLTRPSQSQDGEFFSAGRNFMTGKRYFWRVTAGGAVSETRSFTTASDPIRPIAADFSPNIRDIGGKITSDGRRVKQGLLYRGTYPECARYEDKNWQGLTERGKETFIRELGIKSQIDLRQEAEGRFEKSPVGDGIRYVQVSFDAPFGGTFNDRGLGQMKQAFDVLFDETAYPVYYHCQTGADRTGFLSIVIGGILGFSDSDLVLDYNFTTFHEYRNWRDCSDLKDYFAYLRECFGDHTMSELVMLHLTNWNWGVSADKLYRFREFLTE